ncbi:BsuBI/PstI family type II restriction endonuclease [Pedobacter jeongneungensis]|uniref:BsuBI/PstI family type II restriction endonuclease n=1 Tax=Pedobacter jeongneungensis TaxID=947309 RepID=UPI000E20A424
MLLNLAPNNPVLVFIEVVASDGPVSDRRKEAIYELTDAAGFPHNTVTFVTAYLDRETQAFKKNRCCHHLGLFRLVCI